MKQSACSCILPLHVLWHPRRRSWFIQMDLQWKLISFLLSFSLNVTTSHAHVNCKYLFEAFVAIGTVRSFLAPEAADKTQWRIEVMIDMHIGYSSLPSCREKMSRQPTLLLDQNIHVRRIFTKCGKAIFLPAGVVLLQSALRRLGHGWVIFKEQIIVHR